MILRIAIINVLLFFAFACKKSSSNNGDNADGLTDNTTSSQSEETDDGSITPSPVLTLSVPQKLWNTFKQTADDTDCDAGTVTSLDDCYHDGERISFDITELNSCDGLTIADSSNAFDWQCATSNAGISVSSTGIKSGVSVVSLIDVANQEWKDFSISVSDANGTYTSTPTKIWTNTISTTPTLDTANTVYIFTGNSTSVGLNVAASNITITMEEGGTLTQIAGPNNCSGQQCTINISVVDYIWVDGLVIDGDSIAHNPVKVLSSRFSTFKNLDLQGGLSSNFSSTTNLTRADNITSHNTTSYGFLFNSGNQNSVFENLTVDNVGSSCIYLTSLNSSLVFRNVNLSNCGANGIYSGGIDVGLIFSNVNITNVTNRGILGVVTSVDGIYHNINITNSGDNGILLQGNDNILYNVFSSNASSDDIMFEGDDNIISLASSANTRYKGFKMNSGGSSHHIFQHVAAYNSGSEGFATHTAGSSTILIHNMAVANSGASPLEYNDSSPGNRIFDLHISDTSGNIQVDGNTTDVNVYGRFQVPSNLNCEITGGTPTTNFNDADCSVAVPPAQYFTGSVTSNSFMTSAASPISYALITTDDWLSESTPFQMFGRYDNGGSATYNTDNPATGYCSTGHTCKMWDWRLKNSDTGNPDSGGTPTLQNVFACPDGNATITHSFSSAPSVTFMRYAAEVMFDSIGNDNGLCETDEHCIITPNFGHYQGEGSLVAASATVANTPTCSNIGSGGTVENVTLWKFAVNGQD